MKLVPIDQEAKIHIRLQEVLIHLREVVAAMVAVLIVVAVAAREEEVAEVAAVGVDILF